MGSDHYFSAAPSSPENLRRIRVTLAGRDVEVTTAGGVFSPEHVDVGTAVLLANTPPPPPGGNILDLGCGWGPIALSVALLSPHATVWAVDVNERALDLVRRNALSLGLDNVNAALPDDVPDGRVLPEHPVESADPRGQERAARPARAVDPPPRRAQRRLARRAAQPRIGFAAALAGSDVRDAATACTGRRRPRDSACSACGATALPRREPLPIIG